MKASLLPFELGCLGGCAFVAAVLLLDVGGLGTLIVRDQSVFLALFMLLVQIGGMFGIAVMISSVAAEDQPPARRPQLSLSPATRPLRSPNR